jgi:hypothetical protein
MDVAVAVSAAFVVGIVSNVNHVAVLVGGFFHTFLFQLVDRLKEVFHGQNDL